MSAQFKNDIDSLIKQLSVALTSAQALLEKGKFLKKEFRSILSSGNLEGINCKAVDYQEEIDEYTSIINLLNHMQSNGRITTHDFNYLNQISYMQNFMQSHKENIGVIARRNSL